MGWLKRFFGGDDAKPAPSDEEIPQSPRLRARVSMGTRPDPSGYYNGDEPVPTIIAHSHQRSYEANDADDLIDVQGLDFRTDDDRILYQGRCGITRWKHLGIYVPDFVGESHAQQTALRTIQVGAPARLVPESANDFDPNAIRIETFDGGKVGYIASKGTKSMRRAFNQLEASPVHCAFLERHTLRISGDVVSAKIVLWRPGSLQGMPTDHPHHGPLTPDVGP